MKFLVVLKNIVHIQKNLCILLYHRKKNWPYRMKYSEELQISYRFATYGPP
jgi:hypothetical protein